MNDDRIPPELEDDLRSLRAQPREEFTRELDRRAAEQIERRPKPVRYRAWLGPALGTATAAAVAVIVIAGSGGESGGNSLDVAAMPDAAGPAQSESGAAKDAAPSPSPKAAPQSAAPAPTRKAAPPAGLRLEGRTVAPGQPLVVRYGLGPVAQAEISIAGRSATTSVPAGSGRLSISTNRLPPGTQELRVKLRGAGLRIPVRIR